MKSKVIFKTRRVVVIHGDCTKVVPKLERKKYKLIILDPPYLVTSEKWDKKEVVSPELVDSLFDVLTDDGSVYLWCGLGEKSQSLMRWYPLFSKVFKFRDIITWKKKRGHGMRRGWLYTREEILWFSKSDDYVWNVQYTTEANEFQVGFGGKEVKSAYKRVTNVWTDIPEKLVRGMQKHYTPKPIPAIERIIRAHTSKQDWILDPFMGSGNIELTARRLNRRCVGIELDKGIANDAIAQLREPYTQGLFKV